MKGIKQVLVISAVAVLCGGLASAIITYDEFTRGYRQLVPRDDGFRMGSTQKEILRQLARMHAKIHENTNEWIIAEFKLKNQPFPLKVELAFPEGKLRSVNFSVVTNSAAK